VPDADLFSYWKWQFEKKKIDSLHIACAIIAKCEYFLTTDDKILKRAKLVADINVNYPIGLLKEVLS
jgi:hypothetical protein